MEKESKLPMWSKERECERGMDEGVPPQKNGGAGLQEKKNFRRTGTSKKKGHKGMRGRKGKRSEEKKSQTGRRRKPHKEAVWGGGVTSTKVEDSKKKGRGTKETKTEKKPAVDPSRKDRKHSKGKRKPPNKGFGGGEGPTRKIKEWCPPWKVRNLMRKKKSSPQIPIPAGAPRSGTGRACVDRKGGGESRLRVQRKLKKINMGRNIPGGKENPTGLVNFDRGTGHRKNQKKTIHCTKAGGRRIRKTPTNGPHKAQGVGKTERITGKEARLYCEQS